MAPISFPVALPRVVPVPVWSGLLESNWKPTILPMLFPGAHPPLTCGILSFLSSVYGPGFRFFNALIALSVLSISLCLLSERNQLSLGNLLSKNRLCHVLYEGASPTQVIALDPPTPRLPPWGRVFLRLCLAGMRPGGPGCDDSDGRAAAKRSVSLLLGAATLWILEVQRLIQSCNTVISPS